MLEDELREMAERIGPEADELLAELKDAGIRHKVLTAIRRVIDTRASHLLRIIKKS